MPLALTLVTLPRPDPGAEEPCYLRDGTEPATAFDALVLQHCIVLQARHFDVWQPTGWYYEVSADIHGSPLHTTRMIRGAAVRKTLMDLGKAFVDLENFGGAYAPLYPTPDALAVDFDGWLPTKRDNKLVAVYVLAGGVLRTFVIKVESRGFGMGDLGAARTDPMSEVEYFWFGSAALGYALGLDPGRREPETPTKFSNVIQGNGRTYHRAPDPGRAPFGATPTCFSTRGEVTLYKAFKGQADNLYEQEADVVRQGGRRKKRNRPFAPSAPRIHWLLGADDFLPLFYKTDVAKKRKGRGFDGLGEARMEVGSGTGPAPGIQISKSGTGRGRMPATPTARANGIVQHREIAAALRDRKIALTSDGTMRTDQEWCHLLAASLTGREVDSNFVLGSRHCNSEQLAIESALLFSLDRVLKANRHLKVKITAYLTPGTTQLADVIRYKVLMTSPAGDVLLLDHLIDAQSESFTIAEYRILQETVRRVIALELGGDAVTEYVARINQRIQARAHAVDAMTDVDSLPVYDIPDTLREARRS
jgi:hypothetical protein